MSKSNLQNRLKLANFPLSHFHSKLSEKSEQVMLEIHLFQLALCSAEKFNHLISECPFCLKTYFAFIIKLI
jgi:hypothetical protein